MNNPESRDNRDVWVNGSEADIAAFRAEVCAFLDEAPTAAVREAGRKTTSMFPPFDGVMEWHRILAGRGWSAPAWPVEHGGPGWSAEQRRIFAEECQARDLPHLLPHGLQMVGPLLMALGTEEQKSRYLPGILSGEDFWTQGYSEPNAGSDLAALGCTAVADGDDYIINGSKIWTTYAHHANRMFLLVRTANSGPRQAGITFLLLDRVDYPGMEIREIIGLDGLPEQCEVFFSDVRVPQAGRVGAENDGWNVAKQLLVHERGGGAQGSILWHRLSKVRDAAATGVAPDGGRFAEEPVFQRDLGRVEAELEAFAAYEALVLCDDSRISDSALPSIAKIVSSELAQSIARLLTRATGLNGLADQRDALRTGGPAPLGSELELVAMPFYLNARATSIYAGANEVQRDLIARSMIRGAEPVVSFATTPERAMLRDSLARLLPQQPKPNERGMPVGTQAGATPLWQLLQEMGLLAMPVAEEAGGFGGSAGDLVEVAEQLGSALVLEPYLTSAVLCADMLAAAPDGSDARNWLQRLLDGSSVAALAHEEGASAPYTNKLATVAQPDGEGGYVLNGRKVAVLGAPDADVLVVSASLGVGSKIATFVVEPGTRGVGLTPFRLIDGRAAAHLRLDQVRIPATALISHDAQSALGSATSRALLYIAAETVGVMQSLVRMTLDYATTRQQFGTTLASFQTVAHRLADMKIMHALAKALVLRVAEAVDEAQAEPRMLSALKAQVGDWGRVIGEFAVQIHGGVGMTDEAAPGHYLKRILVSEAIYGAPDYHFAVLGKPPVTG